MSQRTTRVYVVNEPSPRTTPRGTVMYDVSPAKVYGDLVYLFRAADPSPIREREAALRRAHTVLRSARSSDCLLFAGGDPYGLIVATAVLSHYTRGEFTYLYWQKTVRAYCPLRFADGVPDDDASF